jgi:hypothetical protein
MNRRFPLLQLTSLRALRPPLPAALDHRGAQRRLLHHPRQEQAGARLGVLRRRAGPTRGGELAHRDESRRIATNIAKLPALLRKLKSALRGRQMN